ncbi:RNA polymerase sigma factor [Roseateles toxinivorans]|uniref:RNA polymerase sigma-70 factor (ECF subfamily) n=1 Tax=Roseateles toxinivorans TaxID=270368 RepID=A0A4R6QD84_9BURK|nr:sigma-70 family RNA polymerase sigma factor [Roseateles toxinivorans]TDP60411.1 RNA polymerase sigma-70 factor (ECF subfamily) [Roseateles toxinivorans]
MFEPSNAQALADSDGGPSGALPALRGLDGPGRGAERERYIAETFAAHQRPLRSFLGRFLRNEDDIADTVQEVFLRIAQLPDPSKLDINPRAYLFRTAEHLVIDRVRRDSFRQVHLHGPLDDVDVAQPSPSVESQVHWRRAMGQIAQALQADGPRTAQVVEMSCLQDLTHPEIADRLGVTTRTVERCMQRARQVCTPFYIAA